MGRVIKRSIIIFGRNRTFHVSPLLASTSKTDVSTRKYFLTCFGIHFPVADCETFRFKIREWLLGSKFN